MARSSMECVISCLRKAGRHLQARSATQASSSQAPSQCLSMASSPHQAPAYDFTCYFASEELSDLTLRLSTAEEHVEPQLQKNHAATKTLSVVEELATPPLCMELPGYIMVLAVCSPVFKAQLTRWQEQPASLTSTRPVLTLHVDSFQQLQAARALVEFIYKQRVPDDASQQLLVSMLQLADKYDVQSCAAACGACLSSQQQLEWDTAMQVLQLPPAYEQSELFSALSSKAGDKVQQQLGDLEVAWASSEGRKCFMQLPLKGVELLLGDVRTRVAYENTALVAASMWVQQHSNSLTAADERRLVELIRLPNVTPLFASGVLLFLPWLVDTLGMPIVAASMGIRCAAECSRPYNSKAQLSAASGLQWPASWGLGHRPASERRTLSFEWHVPLKELERVFRGHVGTKAVTPVSAHFGGYVWGMQLVHCQSAKSSSDQPGAVGGLAKGTLGMFIAPVIPCELRASSTRVPMMLAAASLVCLRPVMHEMLVAVAAADDCKKTFSRTRPFAAALGWGWPDFWDTGGLAQWEPQRFEKWVDSSGMLTLQLNVSEFL